MALDLKQLEQTRRGAIERLLAERNEAGHWEGRLASSALSTATAVVALALIDRAHGRTDHRKLTDGGARWLIEHQNTDGGWGDTIRSFSNISTTMLGWAALGIAGGESRAHDESRANSNEPLDEAVNGAERWLAAHAGSLNVEALVEAVHRRYGKDRTFSVPILTMCALCGRLGDPSDRRTWRWVLQLPFELAACPQQWFRWLRLPVVSYALPALIAIGIARHTHRPTRNPLARIVRRLARPRTLRVLQSIQPTNGGFLEATPLTSFVTMSLAASGLVDDPVAGRGVGFIERSVRCDGSWPIDTNLATWVTTLSVNALAGNDRLHEHLDAEERRAIRGWLLDQQYTDVHPYTNAPPGGWAWTHLPGGVPDADDTSGALVALAHLNDDGANGGSANQRACRAAQAGLRWLGGLQNGDGGIPTFCRGWGKLPFDRSSNDITAHALSAAARWPSHVGRRFSNRMRRFLRRHQRADGAWTPLWFGNQHLDQEENPTYGTSRVARALAESPQSDPAMLRSAVRWLLGAQNDDGGWGGGAQTPSSTEETALALEALATVAAHDSPASTDLSAALQRGAQWLINRTDRGTAFEPSPIGFYFAKLWYFERLYPIIWTVAALQRVAAWRESETEPQMSTEGHGY